MKALRIAEISIDLDRPQLILYFYNISTLITQSNGNLNGQSNLDERGFITCLKNHS